MPFAALPDETPLFDSAALRTIEQSAMQATGDAFELMRRAGCAAWRELLDRWPQARRLLVVCGPGNNGGDGYLLATHALRSGRDVQVLTVDALPPNSELAREARRTFLGTGGRADAFDGRLPSADLVVDALFGIGLTRAPDARMAALIDAINTRAADVFALDVPSGIDADSGSAPGHAVRATHTLEFIVCKAGLRTSGALDHTGSLGLATLETAPFVADVVPVAGLIAAGALPRWLRPRKRDLHKGRNGRVLCVGGELGGGGAIILCAEAALRSGAGLVEVATRPAHMAPLLGRLPEAIVRARDEPESVEAAMAQADCIAVGPGLGRSTWAASLLQCALGAGRPLVLDADALNLLAEDPRPLPADAVLTPHPGEAARLLEVSIADVQRDRFAAARELAVRHACVVVLKGAGTIVAASDGRLHVIAAGNPGMSVGGMGDVLTGVVAALRAQGLDAFDAAACGALLHAAAGDSAAVAGERGLLPSDLMPWLRHHANPGIPQ